MRRFLAAAVTAMLTLLAVPPGGAASSRVTVEGQVTYPDGTPAAHVHVQLTRVTGLGDALGALFFLGFTAGLGEALCFDSEASDALVACGNNGAATFTDGHGRYRFVLSGAAIDQPDRQFALTARVSRSGRRAPGAQVEVRTTLHVGTDAVPALSVWDPTVTGPLNALTWTDVPGQQHPTYEQHFAARRGFTLDTTIAPGDSLDTRLLEDTQGFYRLVARGLLGALSATWTSPPHPYRGTAGTPLSRGVRCGATVETVRGVVALRRCWLTDADFASPYDGPRPRHCYLQPGFEDPFFRNTVPPQCEYASVERVDLDLGRVVSLAAVVARGECDGCDLLGSVDHVRWTVLHDTLEPSALIDAQGARARWLRVQAPAEDLGGRAVYDSPHARLGGRDLPNLAAGDASRLVELSVWAMTSPQSPSAYPSTSSPSARAERVAGRASGQSRTPALVVAALVLVGAGGAVGIAVAGRRRAGGLR